MSADQRKDVMDKVEDLKKAKEGDNQDLIRSNYEALSAAIQKVGEAMYQQAGPAGSTSGEQATGTDAGTSTDQGPIEGQYEEVNK